MLTIREEGSVADGESVRAQQDIRTRPPPASCARRMGARHPRGHFRRLQDSGHDSNKPWGDHPPWGSVGEGVWSPGRKGPGSRLGACSRGVPCVRTAEGPGERGTEREPRIRPPCPAGAEARRPRAYTLWEVTEFAPWGAEAKTGGQVSQACGQPPRATLAPTAQHAGGRQARPPSLAAGVGREAGAQVPGDCGSCTQSRPCGHSRTLPLPLPSAC